MNTTLAGAALTGIVAMGAIGAAVGTVAQAATASQSVTRYAVTTTNVRTGPGTNYGVVATVAKGTKVTGTLGSNGWIKITSPAADAGKYVSNSVLSSSSPAPVTSPGASTVTGWVASSDHQINVRSGPGFTYPIVSHIAARARVSGTVNGDWIKVSGGYINRGLIETTNANIYAINGYVPPSSLCAIPVAYNTVGSVSPDYTQSTPRYLNCQAVKGLDQLESAYKKQFGHYALIDLAYRDHDEEVYWKKERPKAASPVGTSNHGWGLAVDFHEVDDAKGNEVPSEFYWGHSGYNWLKANAAKYGFAGDPVPYQTPFESYHWNFAG